MLGVASKFVRWVAAKFATAAAIVVFAVLVCALWVYLRDSVDFDQWRQDTVRAITGERAQLHTALADVNQKLASLSTQIATEQQRLADADKVIAGLKDLDSTWDRYLGNREQQKINDGRLASMTETRRTIAAKVDSLTQEFTHTTWTRNGLEIALGKQDAQLQKVQAQRSKIVHYLTAAWNYEIGRGYLRLPIKRWLVIVLGVYFVGPTIGKISLYFVIAPWVTRGRPVRLERIAAALPIVSESRVAAELVLQRGDRLWIKEKFLQASDEGLRKRTRYLLDWRIPLTCLATGLIELIEMMHADAEQRGDLQVTLSNQADPHSELAIVTLSEGASLILRPSFLAGAVTQSGQRLKIRRRWQLFRWQAWVTLQFRFFEFVGPCRLIIAGSRGVRVENLADRAGEGVPARRTNQDATMGFTPNLDYRPVRAETFWSYYRGMNPLFDDLFAGRGIFLCQQVASEGDAKQARKFWANVWGGVMKVFGL
jgi:hypothetical protein